MKSPGAAAKHGLLGAYDDIDEFELERECIEVKRAVWVVKGDADVIVSDIALLIDKDRP